jgi:hypothetical protein
MASWILSLLWLIATGGGSSNIGFGGMRHLPIKVFMSFAKTVASRTSFGFPATVA